MGGRIVLNKKVTTGLTLKPSTIAIIDANRGQTSRSAFIDNLIEEKYIVQQEKPELTIEQWNEIDQWNEQNHAAGITGNVNPEYYLWLKGGKTYTNSPPYFMADAINKSAADVAIRNIANQILIDEVEADQAILAACYEASHNAPGTTHGKSGSSANNNDSKTTDELLAINKATVITNKAILVKSCN